MTCSPPQRLASGLRFQGHRIRIEAIPTRATYTLLAGEPPHLHHHGTPFTHRYGGRRDAGGVSGCRLHPEVTTGYRRYTGVLC